MGGKVVPKAGVPRVVWHRPREKGPVRRANQVDSIPFLAVGRALGDLWSYNFDNKQYAISPQPDVQVLPLDPYEHKCLILATDGLWNLLDYKTAVSSVEMIERKWFREAIYEKGHPVSGDPYYHHASSLVNLVLRRWRSRQLRADNTSAIVVMIDPPGHPVQETLARLSALSAKTREEKKQFCASSYMTENEGELDAAEKYILEMAGAYTLPSHGEKDRFELHFGKPAIRHAVPADTRKSKATSSIAIAGNLPALVDPLDSEPKLRRTLSSNDMKLLQPENERIELDPLPFKDVEELAPSAAADSESLPLCMRDEHPESVKAETNTRDDEAAISPRTTSEEDEPIQCAMDQASPPSVSPSEVPSPQLDRPSQSLSDSPSRPHPIMRHLKGVAKSLVSAWQQEKSYVEHSKHELET
ncbi:hypothetical protein EB796_008259 [Bugula neritina]|uniref:PPM-type phosphatase domain-containing protein n=1 Tax=Bugula neritina TaxID=10212 RepID=A0A7J7K5G0_BUGNE|nr:hypothetical protein EB796_008259 [Bugula neritina]